MRTRIAPQRGGRVLITLLTGLLVGGVIGAGVVYLFGGKRAGKGNVVEPALAKADELNLVPADASAFIHVRISEAWKTDALAGLRGLVKSAGSDAVASIDESFIPSPSSLERATIVLLRPEPPEGAPKKVVPVIEPPKIPGKMPTPPKIVEKPKGEPLESVTILTFTSTFDEAEPIKAKILPEAAKQTANGKDYWVSPRKDGKWDQRDGKMVMVEEYRSERAVHVVNNKTLVVGTGKAMKLFLTRQGVSQGPLAAALKHAAEGNRHVVMAANLQDEFMLNDLRDNLPPEVGPFVSPVFRAQAVSASMVIGDPAKVEFRAFYHDDKSADEALTALREAAQTGWSGKGKPTLLANALKGRGGKEGPHFVEDAVEVVPTLAAVATLNMIQKMIQESEVKVDGKELSASIVYPTAGDAVVQVLLMASGMTIPASQTRSRQERDAALNPVPKVTPGGPKFPGPGGPGIAPMPMGPKNKGPITKADPPKTDDKVGLQEAEMRMLSQNKLKQLAIGLHAYHDTMVRFPGAASMDNDKKPLLSWRVAILPYLDEGKLYAEFKLNEPWDSEHNKKLIARMPKVYTNPRVPAVEGKTYYKVFVSPPGGIYSAFTADNKGLAFPFAFTDGTSNTVLIVEGGDPVEWTKPDDIKFDPKGKAPELTLGGKEDICIVMADGSSRVVKWNAIDAEVRKALITANGGEVLPKDWDK